MFNSGMIKVVYILKKSTKIIGIAIFFVLAVCIIIFLILQFSLKNKDNFYKTNVPGDAGEVIDYEEEQIKKVTERIRYYTVKNCIQTYLNAINQENSVYYSRDEEEKYVLDTKMLNKNIYQLISKEYIEDNSITTNNVENKIKLIKEREIFVPLKMNVLIKEEVEKYVAYGFTVNLKGEYVRELYIMVNLDIINNTFSIEPVNQECNSIDDIKLENNNEQIPKNLLNKFEDQKVSYEYTMNEYVQTYKRMLLAKPEIAYNFLDSEYREKRFGSLEGFKEYVTEKQSSIKSFAIVKYQVNQYDHYTQYVGIDNNENYIIFNEKSIMDFGAILDEYTVAIPQFIEKYNKANEQEKVVLNVQKFINSINDKSYTYAYSLLAGSFKSNNYPTQTSFEKDIKNKFFASNEVKAVKFEKNSNNYVYNLKLVNKDDETEQKELTIVMQLNDETDFVMSFSIE